MSKDDRQEVVVLGTYGHIHGKPAVGDEFKCTIEFVRGNTALKVVILKLSQKTEGEGSAR